MLALAKQKSVFKYTKVPLLTATLAILASGLILAGCKTVRQESAERLQQESRWLTTHDHIQFFAMGANHGSGMESLSVRSTLQYVEQQKPDFGIGLGNHLAAEGRTQFNDIMGRYGWWQTRFFPAIAGGENAAYGEGGQDWGAGAQFLHRNQFLSRAIARHSSEPAISLSARRRPVGEQYIDFRFNEGLKSPQGEPVDYLVNYEKHGIRISAFHIYSFSREGTLPSVDERSLRWLDFELQKIKREQQRSPHPRLTIIFSHGGGADTWLQESVADPYLQSIFSTVDLILMATDQEVAQPIKVARTNYQAFETYKPLILRLGALSDSEPRLLEATVLKTPARLMVRFVNPVDATIDWQRGAYAKDFSRKSNRLQSIDSLETWQELLRH